MSIINGDLRKDPRFIRIVVQTKTLIKIAVVLFVGMIVMTILGVKRTEKPEFCSSCHIMKPYYEAWKTSTHNHVPCIECHYAPGIVNTFEGKFKAISQVAKYVTNTAGTRPWAEIPDESCLREGCHDRRLLQGKEKFGVTVFDHRDHLSELRRGKQLRCTSCHSQVVMGNHLSVTPSTCFVCHFKDKTAKEKWDSCRGCHPSPKAVITLEGKKFKHKEFIDRQVPCMKCHSDVVQGDGRVPRERCYSCHSEQQHTAKYDDTPLIHRKHVTEHKVECFDCHLEISHGIFEAAESKMPGCETCHEGTHKAMLEMYLGKGGKRVAPHRSEMSARQVDCRACHVVNENAPDSEFTGATLKTKDIACMACHGVEYKDILDNWNRTMETLLAETGRLAAGAEAAKKGWNLEKNDLVIARGLLGDAVYNYKFVKNAKGVHNIHYSRELLEKANEIFKALKNPKPEYLRGLVNKKEKTDNLPPDVNCTKLCHTSAPVKKIEFFGKTFPHAKHGPQMGVSCATCHSAEKHGETTLTLESCNKCHHSSAAASAGCRSCHAGSVPTKLGARFPHRKHFENHRLECKSCHGFSAPEGRMALKKTCNDCHHESKQVNCEKCHAEQKKKVEKSAMDYECAVCHKSSGGGVSAGGAACVKCHRTEVTESGKSHPKRDCRICHATHTWGFKGAGTCASCHRDAKHAVKVGGDCATCHFPHEWKN